MFTKEELLMISVDSEEALYNVHYGMTVECPDIARCPLDHFDEDAETVLLRQGILQKAREALK